MPEEIVGRDLADATLWGVDLSRATIRDVNLTGVRIRGALIVDVEIDAFVDRLVINGVDITDTVNAGDRWYPLRALLRPSDVEGMRAAWRALQDRWAATISEARALGEAKLRQSVNGEWSFVETLRHLVMAVDKWFTVPVLGDAAFSPIGLPNTGSRDFPFPGIDLSADPSLDEVLAVRAEQERRISEYLRDLDPAELSVDVDVLENGTVPIMECFFTVFEEEFEHNRYATRDLALLG